MSLGWGPYTKALLSAIPYPDPDVKMQRMTLKGDIPSPANPPSGCRFHTRCPYATAKCAEIVPEYKEYGDGHFAACHILESDNWDLEMEEDKKIKEQEAASASETKE